MRNLYHGVIRDVHLSCLGRKLQWHVSSFVPLLRVISYSLSCPSLPYPSSSSCGPLPPSSPLLRPGPRQWTGPRTESKRVIKGVDVYFVNKVFHSTSVDRVRIYELIPFEESKGSPSSPRPFSKGLWTPPNLYGSPRGFPYRTGNTPVRKYHPCPGMRRPGIRRDRASSQTGEPLTR